MNRNKAFWSVMGIEPNPDQKQFTVEKLKIQLIELIEIYSFDTVVTSLREIKESNPDMCKTKINLFMR